MFVFFPRYWPFVRGIHRSPVNSPHKGQWRVALMFSLICSWTNGWVKNRDAGDLRRHRAHYDVTVMAIKYRRSVVFIIRYRYFSAFIIEYRQFAVCTKNIDISQCLQYSIAFSYFWQYCIFFTSFFYNIVLSYMFIAFATEYKQCIAMIINYPRFNVIVIEL